VNAGTARGDAGAETENVTLEWTKSTQGWPKGLAVVSVGGDDRGPWM
jgi:hypothetical protein